MIEREGGYFILKTVEARDLRILSELLRQFIVENPTIMSDKWAAYLSYFSNNRDIFNHYSVNHSENFVNPNNLSIHNQTIEVFWSILKGCIRSKKLTQREKLETYIAEFRWRKCKNLSNHE